MLEDLVCLKLTMAANLAHSVFVIDIPSILQDAVYHMGGTNNEQVYHDRGIDPGNYDPLNLTEYSPLFEDFRLSFPARLTFAEVHCFLSRIAQIPGASPLV